MTCKYCDGSVTWNAVCASCNGDGCYRCDYSGEALAECPECSNYSVFPGEEWQQGFLLPQRHYRSGVKDHHSGSYTMWFLYDSRDPLLCTENLEACRRINKQDFDNGSNSCSYKTVNNRTLLTIHIYVDTN